MSFFNVVGYVSTDQDAATTARWHNIYCWWAIIMTAILAAVLGVSAVSYANLTEEIASVTTACDQSIARVIASQSVYHIVMTSPFCTSDNETFAKFGDLRERELQCDRLATNFETMMSSTRYESMLHNGAFDFNYTVSNNQGGSRRLADGRTGFVSIPRVIFNRQPGTLSQPSSSVFQPVVGKGGCTTTMYKDSCTIAVDLDTEAHWNQKEWVAEVWSPTDPHQ